MLTRSFALALLATVMVGGAAVNRAEAVVAGPATASAEFIGDATIMNARWVCGPVRCEWHAWGGMLAPRHSWTTNWGIPRTPGCFYEKRRGRWREICPR